MIAKRLLLNSNGEGIVDLEGRPRVAVLMLVMARDAVEEDMASKC